jgi:DNA-binding MarR family transcriptional regulator
MQGEEDEVGPLATRLSYQLRRLDLLAMERLYDLMIEIGVPPGRGTALVYIDLHPGCDQATLGRVLGINRASTMAAVNALVGLSAVERRPGRDNRSNGLHLTSEGQRLVAEMMQITAGHDAQFFGALTDKERAELLRLVLKVRAANGATAPRDTATRRANLRRVK